MNKPFSNDMVWAFNEGCERTYRLSRNRRRYHSGRKSCSQGCGWKSLPGLRVGYCAFHWAELHGWVKAEEAKMMTSKRIEEIREIIRSGVSRRDWDDMLSDALDDVEALLKIVTSVLTEEQLDSRPPVLKGDSVREYLARRW